MQWDADVACEMMVGLGRERAVVQRVGDDVHVHGRPEVDLADEGAGAQVGADGHGGRAQYDMYVCLI